MNEFGAQIGTPSYPSAFFGPKSGALATSCDNAKDFLTRSALREMALWGVFVFEYCVNLYSCPFPVLTNFLIGYKRANAELT